MMNSILAALAVCVLAAARAAAQIEVVVPPAEEVESEAEAETSVERSQHEVVKANTLWDLAAHYYKDPWQWPRIHEANKDKIKDPHWIYPGQVFVIPGFDKLVRVEKRAPGEAVSVTPPPPEPPAPAPPAPAPKASEQAEADGLSARLPEGQAGQQPAVYRVRKGADWKEDGEILDLADRVVMAAQGGTVRVRLARGIEAGKGWRYGVYRVAAPLEGEKGSGARYLQRVGTLEIAGKDGKRDYQALVVRSGGELGPGDLLKREE